MRFVDARGRSVRLSRPAAVICAGGPCRRFETAVSQQFDLGIHFFLTKEYDRAARAFREVLRDEPRNPRVWSYLGMAEAHLGRAAEAEANLARALELSPTNAQAWFHLGVARALREDWNDAASAYRRAVAFAPSDLVAWHRLGVALAESGEGEAATAAFERALILSRETGDLPIEEVTSPEEEDVHAAEVGEREGPREAKSWLDLALSLLSLGNEEEAVAAFERAYTLDPKRASSSLFRPMLQLMIAAREKPPGTEETSESPEAPRPPRPPAPDDVDYDPSRPEVS